MTRKFESTELYALASLGLKGPLYLHMVCGGGDGGGVAGEVVVERWSRVGWDGSGMILDDD